MNDVVASRQHAGAEDVERPVGGAALGGGQPRVQPASAISADRRLT